MDNKVFHGYIAISSTIIQEPSFIDYRYIVYKAAGDLGYYAKRNSEEKGSTQREFDNYLMEKRPVFILILGEISSYNVIKECQLALKLGLDIMTFLKTNKPNHKISETTQKTMEAISRITYDKECSNFENCEELYESVIYRLKEYETFNRNRKSNFIRYRPEIYPQASKMVLTAKSRLIICQKTSTFLLGPRNGQKAEKEFYDNIINWIQTANDGMEFCHIFSLAKTRNEVLKNDDDYRIEEAKSTLNGLIQNVNNKIELSLRTMESDLYPYVVADNSLLISMFLGKKEYYLNLPNEVLNYSTLSEVITDLNSSGRLFYSNKNPNFENIQKIYKP